MHLKLIAKSYRAEQAFCLPNNSDHYQPRSPSCEQVSAGCSRATTSSDCQDNCDEDSRASQLIWTADAKLKNPAKGFCCGRDPRRCDVVLGATTSDLPISGVHFSITQDAGKRFVLHDDSKLGTKVSYDGKSNLIRRQFKWILFPEHQIIVTIEKDLISKLS